MSYTHDHYPGIPAKNAIKVNSGVLGGAFQRRQDILFKSLLINGHLSVIRIENKDAVRLQFTMIAAT
jgi:hypothetical protein